MNFVINQIFTSITTYQTLFKNQKNKVKKNFCDTIKIMERENYKISIAYLYPEFMNLYGDIGNITTLKKRCEWRNIEADIHEIHAGDDIEGYDFYFLGAGSESQQETVAQILNTKKHFLKKERDDGAVFLGIDGGYQVFGNSCELTEKKFSGIGLIDAETIVDSKRHTGNVTVSSDFLTPQTLVGFENHNGTTYIKNDTMPLGRVVTGFGNNGQDKTEGARFINVFGTYMHGPILPKNPHFADYLIKLALKKHYNEDIELDPIDDDLEFQTHKSLINKSY